MQIQELEQRTDAKLGRVVRVYSRGAPGDGPHASLTVPLDVLVAFTGGRLLPNVAPPARGVAAAGKRIAPAPALAHQADAIAAALQVVSLSAGGAALPSLGSTSALASLQLETDSASGLSPAHTPAPLADGRASATARLSPAVPADCAAEDADLECTLALPPAAAARAWPLLQLLAGAVPETLTPQAAAQIVSAAQHLAGDTLVDMLPEYLAPVFDEASGLCGREVRLRVARYCTVRCHVAKASLQRAWLLSARPRQATARGEGGVAFDTLRCDAPGVSKARGTHGVVCCAGGLARRQRFFRAMHAP